jgi:Lrp/AsnC family leucine-responsive transcriptional regulator
VIRGYSADISREALGYDLDVFVGLQIEQGPPLSETIEQLGEIPEVTTIDVVTGHWDLVIQLHARNHRHLQDVLLSRVWAIPGFRHSETMLVLRSTTHARAGILNMLIAYEPPELAQPQDETHPDSA